MTDSIQKRLLRGEIVSAGSKLYKLCPNCRKIVQINKWLLGSVHVCAPDNVPD